MTDKATLTDIERRVWELRAAIVHARNAGLVVNVHLAGNFEGGPTLFNDLFDKVQVVGTRSAGGGVTAGEFSRMVEAA